jgi:hypothetical protein
MASSIQHSRVINKGPSVFVTNNHSNHTAFNSGTNNGTVGTNIKSLELSITQKVEAIVEANLFSKLNVKFDACVNQINKSLDNLVDCKVRKYLMDCNIDNFVEGITNVQRTAEEIEDLVSTNMETIVSESIKNFPLLEEISTMTKELRKENPNICSIPVYFNPEDECNQINPETKQYKDLILSADILKYFSFALFDSPTRLADRMKSEEPEGVNSKSFQERYGILESYRHRWLNFLRSVWKHKTIQDLFIGGINIRLKDSPQKDGLQVVSTILANAIHKEIFGMNKIHCNIFNEDDEQYCEFALPSIMGIFRSLILL